MGLFGGNLALWVWIGMDVEQDLRENQRQYLDFLDDNV